MPSKDGNGGKPAAVICIGNLLFFGGSPFRTNRGATLACNTGAVLIGASELRYTRHPDPATQTGELLASAIAQVSQEAGIAPEEIDGLGVSSFTFGPDHAVDLALRCGMNLRSEEHTSELQSRLDLVCRLLLEKKRRNR